MEREIIIKTSKGDAMFLRKIFQQIITANVLELRDEHEFLVFYQKKIDAVILEDDQKLLNENNLIVSERFGIASEGKPVRRNYLDVCREFMDACHEAGWHCTYRASGVPPRVGGNWVFDKAVVEARTWAKENQSELLIKFEQEIAP